MITCKLLIGMAVPAAFLLATAPALAASPTSQQQPPTVRTVGTARLENVPEVPATISAAVQRYQSYRAAVFQDWLADGSILITTRFGNSQQVHRVGTSRRHG